MSIIFFILMLASTLALIFKNPGTFLQITSKATHSSLVLVVSLAGVLIFWCAILEVAKQSGITQKLSKALSPIIRKLFGKVSKKAEEHISTNIAANLLGMGSAATMPAIEAMSELEQNPQTESEKEKTKKGKATFPMIMLFILATCSIQLIPTTVIGLLQSAGSTNAGSIILPGLITSIASTMFGIILLFATSNSKPKQKNPKGDTK